MVTICVIQVRIMFSGHRVISAVIKDLRWMVCHISHAQIRKYGLTMHQPANVSFIISFS